MTAGLRGTDRPLAELHDLALVDLDGVVYKGHEPVPHAAESLTAARDGGLALQFVTNNASREPEAVAEQLTSLGVATRPGEVFTAAQAGAALLTTRLAPGARVLVVGGAGLHTAVSAAGYAVVASADDAPDAVIQGFAPTLGWSDLAEAAYAVAGGAWFVATNLDLSLPTDRGYAPGNGALVGAVQAATGVRPDSAGKPEPTMYRLAVERTGARSPLVVGDRLDTDLAGARAAGYPGLHVLTGVSSARDAVLARPGERPDYLGADLRSLADVHPLPARTGDWWECRDAAARVVSGALEVRGDGLDAARAACAAAWDAADRGETVDPDTVPALGVGSSRDAVSDR
ncbi:MAG TPA: HAD-IIA family hydrolase [Luteimicrobium sp.]|nr:HAD-IIA family hydrolase [Luteimicrobium sp.]